VHSLTPCHSSFLHRAKFLMLHEQDFHAKIVRVVDDLQDMKEAYRLTSVAVQSYSFGHFHRDQTSSLLSLAISRACSLLIFSST